MDDKQKETVARAIIWVIVFLAAYFVFIPMLLP
jgi:hypothetical protein